MSRTPDEILQDVGYLIDDEIVFNLIWEVIDDCLDSMRLAVNTLVASNADDDFTTQQVEGLVITVEEYMSSHYGE